MEKQTILFYGRSGAGKGTQALLLKKFLEEQDPDAVTLHIETGKGLRHFAERNNYTSKLNKNVLDTGGLIPAFMPIWVWVNYFIENYTGEEHLLLDGLARKPHEAPILAGALEFYQRKKIHVVIIDVSHEWAFDRLKERGRSDDDDQYIKERLKWYDNEVVHALDYFKQHCPFTTLVVNGERPMAEVHKDLLQQLNLVENDDQD
jgi:adenylate kinase